MIFDRDHGETKSAFNAFLKFRNFGPTRNVDRVFRASQLTSDESKRAPTHWWRWHTDHNWKVRAEAYDLQNEKIERQAHERELEKLGARKAQNAMLIQDRLEELANWERNWLEKNNPLPASDVERFETKEVPDGSGGIEKTVTRTKVKGMKSLVPRLALDYKDTLERMGPSQSAEGQREAPETVPLLVEIQVPPVETDYSAIDRLPRQ